MRTVILEEHFSLPAASARVDKAVIARRGYKPRALRKDVPHEMVVQQGLAGIGNGDVWFGPHGQIELQPPQ